MVAEIMTRQARSNERLIFGWSIHNSIKPPLSESDHTKSLVPAGQLGGGGLRRRRCGGAAAGEK